MRVLGIIAEYNPFHNGHQYHIKAAKAALNPDYTVVVMSGNFVQRGEPAIIHKWSRAEMCLNGGVDLVIELPVYYSTASAEYFAKGAVKILDSTNIIDFLSFGAECEQISQFNKTLYYTANEPPEYKQLIKEALSEGDSFPTARGRALNALLQEHEKIHNTPNNILGIEYLKALRALESNIHPHIVKRHVAGHNSMELGEFYSSASAIRNSIHESGLEKVKGTLPKCSYNIMRQAFKFFPISYESYTDLILYKIKTSTKEQLKQIFDISEGLENRIVNASCSETLDSIITQIKSKRYTFTKIQRILLHILLDIKNKDILEFDLNGGPQYIRVIGFKRSAAPLIRKLSDCAGLPIIMNIKKDITGVNGLRLKMIEKEIEATDIYFIKSGEPKLRRTGVEYTMPLVIVD